VSVTPTSGELNCNVSSVLLTASVTGGETPYTYQWYKNGAAISGATNSTYTATSAGTYKVVVTDHNGCTDTSADVVVVSVPDPDVSVTPTSGTLTCTVRQLLLTASVTGGKGPYTYQWYKNGVAISGATGSTYTVKSAGTYKVRVTDVNGCSDNSNEVEIGYDYGVQVSGHKYDADTMEPIAGWNIYIRKTVGGANLYSTTTDENGYYSFTGITECNQALWVVEEQRAGWQYVSYYYKEINLTCPPSGTSAGQGVEPDRQDPNCPPAQCGWTVDFKNRRVCPTVSVTPTSGELNCNVSSVLLTANVSGGVGPFTYQWYKNGAAITGATSSTYTATSAGTYYVRVGDGPNCDVRSNDSVVTSVPDPDVSVTPTSGELNCNVSSVLLTASVTGGETPYTYQWYKNGAAISGATNSTYTATSAGTYKVVVTDHNGCTDTSADVVVVSVPDPEVSVTPTGGELNCNVSSVLLTASVTGGESPYTYQWYKNGAAISGATNSTYSATSAGTYKVIVTDHNGCTDTSADVGVVSVPDPDVSVTPTSGELNCNVASVLLTASVTGGETPYTYQWYKNGAAISGATNSTYTATSAGTYKVVVTDHNGCTDTSADVVVVSVPDPDVSVTPTGGELNCNVSSVLLTASVTGGETPYTYQWYKNGAAITGATNSTYSATSAGTYKVVVTDHNGCTDTSADVVVTSVPDPDVSVTPTSGELNCNVASVLLTASVTGGETPYTYQWYKNGAAISGATNSTYSATSAGTYKVVVTDHNGCTDTSADVVVTSVPDPDVSVTPTGGELNCNVSSVLLTASVTGGETPYTYQWYKNGTAISGATNSTYTATSAGTYKVIVTDHNGCTDTSADVAVTSVPDPDVSVTPTGGELNCNVSSVLLTASVTGGESPYTYKWYKNGAAISGATNSTYSATSAGTYKVIVTDHNGCTDTSADVVVTSVPDPDVSVTPTGGELNCNVSSVLLTASVTGGETPYTYQWYKNGTAISGATNSTYTATSAGTYKVIVTDHNGCTDTSADVVVVSVPDPDVSVTPTSGTLTCTVRQLLLTASVTGGKGPYTYQWYKNGVAITGATNSTYSATSAGTYKVIVTDHNGCTDTSADVVVVSVPDPDVSVTPTSGTLTCTVRQLLLTASVTGGKGPYTYQWYKNGVAITGATNSTYSATSAGTYKVVVTDHNGCTDTSADVVVTSVPDPDVSVTPTSGELNCKVSSVLLTASVTGGETPYTYQWYKNGAAISGATNSTYSATSAGTYKVVVTDHNGCTDTSADVVVVSVPDPDVSVTPTGGELNCNVSSVLLTASVTGGETPYTYQWYKNGAAISGATNSTYSATSAGTYKVVVTDHNGCTDTSADVVVVSVPDPDVSVTPTSGELNCKVSSVLLTASVTGGETPYTYQWYKNGAAITGATNSTYSATSAGTYKVVVTDHNGCTDTSADVVVVSVPDPDVSVTPTGGELNCKVSSVLLTASVTGGETPYTYQWYKNGAAISGATNSTYSATSAGTYKVIVTDHNGCTDTSADVVVTSVPDPDVSVTPTGGELNCNVSSVLLTASVTGGESPYTYQWYKNGTAISEATNSTYTATSAGTYKVVVTDHNGCTDTSADVVVTSVPDPDVSVTPTSGELNCNVSSVLLTATLSGGEANFTYFWYRNDVLVATHGPTSLITDTYLATTAGTYSVVVVDNNQCEDASEPVPVVYVPPPQIVLTKSVDQCEGTAVFTVTRVSGGEPPYYFAWDVNGDGVYSEFPRQTVITITGHAKAGTVAVRLFDNNNCMDQASTTYAINDELAVEAEIVSLPDCTGEACFTAVATGGAAPYTYEWDLDNDGQYDDYNGQSPCRVFPDAGSYTVRVKVTDASGCTAYDTLSFELHGCNGELKVAFDADIEVCDLNATFYLTVTNTGTCGSFQDIVITVEAVEGAGYIADILPYVWNVGDLPAGESRSTMVAVSFNALWDTVPAGTVTRLRARVTAENCNGPVTIGVEDTVTATRPPEPPDAYEVDNTSSQAKFISVDGTPQLHSLHEEPDVDWIKFNATAGNEYVITTFDLSRLVDTIIELYGPDMTLLATNDDFGGGKGSQIAWVAETSGTYYVKIRPKYPELCGCENGYKVKVEEFKQQLECPCPEWIVFHSDRDGNWELYRLDAAGGTPVRLTNDPAIDMAPTRSSDAVWIAFQTNRNGLWDIYKVDALGENLTQLTANAGNNLDPMWSTPCGSEQIAFQSDRDGNWEIYIMDGNGNGQMRLTDDPAPDEDPFWSPDGMYIAFQSRRNGNWDIYVVDVTGTDLIQLTNDPADEVDPVWSPDGQYIAFRSNRDGEWHTYVMPAAGGDAVKVSGAGNNLNAVWSPDSQWLAYQSDRDGQSEIYAVNILTLLETRVTDNAATDEAPTWSCDSQHIVFHTNRDGNWEIYMTDILDTSALVRLTDDPHVDAYPMWNPPSEDGSRMGIGRLYRNRVHIPIGH